MKTTKEIGDKGENIACLWLKNKGFLVIERNYRRKWGEIDIIATKDKTLHFIEVKAISHDSVGYRPEENVHELKQRRLKRTIQTYLFDKKVGIETPFQFHVITIVMDDVLRKAEVTFMENIII